MSCIVEVDGRPVGVGRRRAGRSATASPSTSLGGHVDPERSGGAGIGRALLRENIRRAAERAATRGPGPAVEIRAVRRGEPGRPPRPLAAHGFEPVRWFFLMRRPSLDDVPEAPLPDGLEIRPVAPDQHRAILEAENEAFRDHWGHREHDARRNSSRRFGRAELDTDLWVVAWDGDEIAGRRPELDLAGGERARSGSRRGWLEHISVRRPWRRRGLARAITAASLRRLRDAGMTEAMLGVDADNPTGALGLYEGLGFEVHQRSSASGAPLAELNGRRCDAPVASWSDRGGGSGHALLPDRGQPDADEPVAGRRDHRPTRRRADAGPRRRARSARSVAV